MKPALFYNIIAFIQPLLAPRNLIIYQLIPGKPRIVAVVVVVVDLQEAEAEAEFFSDLYIIICC